MNTYTTSGSTTVDAGAHIVSGSTTAPLFAPPSPFIKLTVNVRRSLFEQLIDVAQLRGMTPTEALQEALATYVFVQQKVQQGEKFLSVNREGMRQVFFDCMGKPVPHSSARTAEELLEEIRRG